MLPASGLPDVPDGDRVLVAGVVTHRQRPATASGTTFVNLEDETGLVNVICSKGCWARYRQAALTAPALLVRGKLEKVEGVVNVIALDFDPSRAIVQAGGTGNYNLKPTGIRIVQLDRVLATYGSLSGSVLPAAAQDDAIVSVIPEGQTAPVAAGSVNPEDGSFRAMVPAGTYTVMAEMSVVAADNP